MAADTSRIHIWRRTDGPGLEVLRVSSGPDGHRVRSELVDGTEVSFAARYEGDFSPQWRSRWLRVELGGRTLSIEHLASGTWKIDGQVRPDLQPCDELDLAASPFSNMLAIQRLALPIGESAELTTAYLAFPALTVQPSRQRYERLGPRQFRYVDLGVAAGFEADLVVDDHDMVRSYQGLFEAVTWG